MTLKKTQKEVEENITKKGIENGYKIREKFEYLNSKSNIPLICNNGHEFELSYNRIVSKNNSCPVCKNRKRKTPEEALSKLQEICNIENYSIIGDFVYKNNKSTINLKCNKDGHEWSTKYTSFVNTGYRCAKCAGTAKRTDAEISTFMDNICREKEYTLTSPLSYKNCKANTIHLRCKNNHEFSTSVAKLEMGYGCIKCSQQGKKRLVITNDEIKNNIDEYCNKNGYILLNDIVFKHTSTLLSLKCTHDGHEWSTKYRHIMSNRGCAKCSGKLRLSQEEVDKKIYDICKIRNYTLMEKIEYKNYKSIIKLKCDNGHEISMQYNKFVSQGHGCGYCSKNKKYTNEEAHEIINKELNKRKYTLSEDFTYINNKTAIKVTCNNNHTFNTTFCDLTTAKKGCAKCANNAKHTQEEAENIINKILSEKNFILEEPFKYKNIYTKIKLKCNSGHVWSASFGSLYNNGSGCKICSGKNQTYAYINFIYDNEIPIGVKYGVENICGNRIKDQNIRSVFLIERFKTLVYFLFFEQ